MALIIFDIDGTLVDSSSLTVSVVTDIVGRFAHLTVPDAETVRGTFGMSEPDMWAALMPEGTLEERQRASAMYDVSITEELRRVDVLLPHAVDVLSELKRRGYTLTTASNCDRPYLDAVLDTQGSRSFFERPLCLGMVQGRAKSDILTRHFQYFEREGAVMIGDRRSDLEAAQAHAIPAIGCTFGFGDAAELRGADWTIEELPDLLYLLPPLFFWFNMIV